jgi:hypothetical protein
MDARRHCDEPNKFLGRKELAAPISYENLSQWHSLLRSHQLEPREKFGTDLHGIRPSGL